MLVLQVIYYAGKKKNVYMLVVIIFQSEVVQNSFGVLDPFSAGTVFIRQNMTSVDVCRRHILTYKDDPHTEFFLIFLMAVEPYHRYSNQPERAN